MLTDAQRDWVCKQQNKLISFYESNYPLTDEKAKEICEWIAETVEKAKGKKTDARDDVRKALFDIVEVYDFAENVSCMKKYGLYESSYEKVMNRWSKEQKELFKGAISNG